MTPCNYLMMYCSISLSLSMRIRVRVSAHASRSLLMAIIVEKSKKCLDFSFTLFVVHLIIVSAYDGFPATWDWWIVHILSMICMVLLSEFLCSRREMEEIPLLQL